MSEDSTIFQRIGGKPYLQKIAKRFYDKLYAHPWLQKYFVNVRQEFIESQQVDFMSGVLGGPKEYSGRTPADAHPHLYITEELFNLREKFLMEALVEEKASAELIERWFKTERAFKHHIVKKTISECSKRWTMDEILSFENPESITKIKKAS
jgi:truncated hemoglobin YjbI